jgi:hypothetical protein
MRNWGIATVMRGSTDVREHKICRKNSGKVCGFTLIRGFKRLLLYEGKERGTIVPHGRTQLQMQVHLMIGTQLLLL